MKKILVSCVLIMTVIFPHKAVAINETALTLFLNSTITELMQNQERTTTQDDTTGYFAQTGAIAALILAGQIVPPLWTKIIKPLGNTAIDIFVSATQKYRACYGALGKSDVASFIEADTQIAGKTQKILLTFFDALDKETRKHTKNPLYKKTALEDEAGFIYTIPNIYVELTRALDNEAYGEFSAKKKHFDAKSMKTFSTLLKPHIQPHMRDTAYNNLYQGLNKLKTNALLQFFDIIDEDTGDVKQNQISLEFGVIAPMAQKDTSHDDKDEDSTNESNSIAAVFSSRYRVILKAYEIPTERQEVAQKKLKKNSKKKNHSIFEDNAESDFSV